jgi:hypothetical protein
MAPAALGGANRPDPGASVTRPGRPPRGSSFGGPARGGTDAFLHAYDGLAVEELGDFIAAHRLYMTIWKASAAQRRAQMPNTTDVTISQG